MKERAFPSFKKVIGFKEKMYQFLIKTIWLKIFPIKIFSLNVFFTTWFNSHLVLWVKHLYLPCLETIGLAEKEILHFKFFMWIHMTASWKNHVTPWLASCHHTSPFCQVWWYRPCRRDDIKFSIWHVTSCDHVIRVMWFHFGLRLAIRQYNAKFCGHLSSRGTNISFLVCHVTSCDQVVKGTCDFMGTFTSP